MGARARASVGAPPLAPVSKARSAGQNNYIWHGVAFDARGDGSENVARCRYICELADKSDRVFTILLPLALPSETFARSP
jgi:hypothetical protein